MRRGIFFPLHRSRRIRPPPPPPLIFFFLGIPYHYHREEGRWWCAVDGKGKKEDTWSVPLFPQSQSGSGGAKTLEERGDLRNFLFSLFLWETVQCPQPRLLQKKRVTGGIVPFLGGFRLAPCAIAGGEREEEEPRQAQGVIRSAQRRRKGIKIF